MLLYSYYRRQESPNPSSKSNHFFNDKKFVYINDLIYNTYEFFSKTQQFVLHKQYCVYLLQQPYYEKYLCIAPKCQFL